MAITFLPQLETRSAIYFVGPGGRTDFLAPEDV